MKTIVSIRKMMPVFAMLLSLVVLGVPLATGATQSTRAFETGYEYDAADRLIRMTRPDGVVVRYEYGRSGRLLAEEACRRNDRGRLEPIDAPQARTTYTYDDNGNVIEIANGAGRTSFFYDAHERPIKAAFDYEHLNKSVVREYDPWGRVAELRVEAPGGDVEYRARFSYDISDRLRGIEADGDTLRYDYDASDRTVTRTLPNGGRSKWTYGEGGTLGSIVHTGGDGKNLASFAYEYDDANRIVAIEERIGDKNQTVRYRYDDAGRLVRAAESGGDIREYRYDEAGRRVSVAVNGEVRSRIQHDDFGRMETYNGRPCSYDALGNLTAYVSGDGKKEFSYGLNNMLKAVRGGGHEVEYHYDATGLLIGRTYQGQHITYVPDPFARIWRPLYAYGDEDYEARWLWHGESPLAETVGGKREYLLHDHLHTPRARTSQDGNIMPESAYTPFGARRDPASATTLRTGFSGLLYDAQASISLTRARAYDPGLRSFLQRDPVPDFQQQPLKWSPRFSYAYCGDDPVNFVDIDGAERERINSALEEIRLNRALESGRPDEIIPDLQAKKRQLKKVHNLASENIDFMNDQGNTALKHLWNAQVFDSVVNMVSYGIGSKIPVVGSLPGILRGNYGAGVGSEVMYGLNQAAHETALSRPDLFSGGGVHALQALSLTFAVSDILVDTVQKDREFRFAAKSLYSQKQKAGDLLATSASQIHQLSHDITMLSKYRGISKWGIHDNDNDLDGLFQSSADSLGEPFRPKGVSFDNRSKDDIDDDLLISVRGLGTEKSTLEVLMDRVIPHLAIVDQGKRKAYELDSQGVFHTTPLKEFWQGEQNPGLFSVKRSDIRVKNRQGQIIKIRNIPQEDWEGIKTNLRGIASKAVGADSEYRFTKFQGGLRSAHCGDAAFNLIQKALEKNGYTIQRAEGLSAFTKNPNWTNGDLTDWVTVDSIGGGQTNPIEAKDRFDRVQPKGVRFDQPAEFVGDIGAIKGVYFDPETKEFALIGDGDLSLPPIRKDDFVAALHAVYSADSSGYPEFSLDPKDRKNPAGEFLKPVYRPTFMEGTHMGDVMLRADWVLKHYAMGVAAEYDGTILGKRCSSVPTYASYMERVKASPEALARGAVCSRFWIVARDMKLARSGETIVFSRAKMGVKAQRMDQTAGGLQDSAEKRDVVAQAFANDFTAHYDRYADESPVLEEVREAAKVVAIVMWLKAQGLGPNDFDIDWAEVPRMPDYEREPIHSVSVAEAAHVWGLGSVRLQLIGGVKLAPRLKSMPAPASVASLGRTVGMPAANGQRSAVWTVDLGDKAYRVSTVPILAGSKELLDRCPVTVKDGVTYAADEQHRVRHAYDRWGNTATFDYDDESRLTEVRHRTAGNWRLHARLGDQEGKEIGVRSPAGHEKQYSFDARDRLMQAVVDGRTTMRCTWEGDSVEIQHLAMVKDRFSEIGNITGKPRMQEKVVAREKIVDGENSYSYSRTHNGATETIEARHSEDSATIRLPEGEKLELKRMDNNTVVSTGPAGTITYEYAGADGPLRKVTSDSGEYIEFPSGEKTEDGLDIVLRTRRGDAEARMAVGDGTLSVRNFDGIETSHRYDTESGRLERIASPFGTTSYEYDNGRLAAVRFPGGVSKHFAWQEAIGASRLTVWREVKD